MRRCRSQDFPVPATCFDCGYKHAIHNLSPKLGAAKLCALRLGPTCYFSCLPLLTISDIMCYAVDYYEHRSHSNNVGPSLPWPFSQLAIWAIMSDQRYGGGAANFICSLIRFHLWGLAATGPFALKAPGDGSKIDRQRPLTVAWLFGSHQPGVKIDKAV